MYVEIVAAFAPSARLLKVNVTGAAIAVPPSPNISVTTLRQIMNLFIFFPPFTSLRVVYARCFLANHTCTLSSKRETSRLASKSGHPNIPISLSLSCFIPARDDSGEKLRQEKL
jgi:hypothetical protein